MKIMRLSSFVCWNSRIILTLFCVRIDHLTFRIEEQLRDYIIQTWGLWSPEKCNFLSHIKRKWMAEWGPGPKSFEFPARTPELISTYCSFAFSLFGVWITAREKSLTSTLWIIFYAPGSVLGLVRPRRKGNKNNMNSTLHSELQNSLYSFLKQCS